MGAVKGTEEEFELEDGARALGALGYGAINSLVDIPYYTGSAANAIGAGLGVIPENTSQSFQRALADLRLNPAQTAARGLNVLGANVSPNSAAQFDNYRTAVKQEYPGTFLAGEIAGFGGLAKLALRSAPASLSNVVKVLRHNTGKEVVSEPFLNSTFRALQLNPDIQLRSDQEIREHNSRVIRDSN